MADKTTGGLTAVEEAAIGSLPGIADLYDETLIPVEQQGEARHMTGAQWKRYAQAGVSKYVEDAQKAASDAQKAVAAVGTAVEESAASAEEAKTARKGAEAAREAIENMEVSADTLSTGQPASVTKTTENGVAHLTFGLPKGAKGAKGDAGASIQSIERTAGTGAAGTVDTYTITLTDGSTHDFRVYNGADGEGSGDMMKAIYDPENRNTDIFNYVDEKVKDVPRPDNLVTVPGSGSIDVPKTLGDGPYTIEFTGEDEQPVAASEVTYSGSSSGMASRNVQAAIDYLKYQIDFDRENPDRRVGIYFGSSAIGRLMFPVGSWHFVYQVYSSSNRLRILSDEVGVIFFPNSNLWPKDTLLVEVGAFDFGMIRWEGKTPVAALPEQIKAYWIDQDGVRTDAAINYTIHPISGNIWKGIGIQLQQDYTKPGCWLYISIGTEFNITSE